MHSPNSITLGLKGRNVGGEAGEPEEEEEEEEEEEAECPGETTRSKKRSIVRLSGYHRTLRYLLADKRTRDLHTVGEIRSTRRRVAFYDN